MSEKLWSPFDPEWYKYAFDKFISTAEQLFYQDEIISQGYVLPDSDGSRSSVFRQHAVLNNSFNESLLRETLKDIYLNSSHKLTASNHDNVHFFQWVGCMHDVTPIANSNYCEIRIPTENFIPQSMRDIYKRSPFFNKWISITQLMQNWDSFKWTILLFINQKIYSEYMIRIDDQETCIRFEYQQFWMDRDYPIYIYKFDTVYQNRIKIARDSIMKEDRWNWKVDLPNYFGDSKILNQSKVIVVFNRIADSNERTDGKVNIDAMGDNLEFLTVENGVIDLSNISKSNKLIINSEYREYIWMTIFVPKFFHEFPIPLATDVVYRPYSGKYDKVWAIYNGEYHQVKVDKGFGDPRNLYINLDDNKDEWNDGWKSIIRPMVLSDAFNSSYENPYISIRVSLDKIDNAVVDAMNALEELHLFMDSYTTDEWFLELCDKVEQAMNIACNEYEAYLTSRNIDPDENYDSLVSKFGEMMKLAREQKRNFGAFMRQYSKKNDFWMISSELLDCMRNLIARYDIIGTLSNISNSTIWEEKLDNQFRFRRPVDASDIITFRFYPEENVWRPYPLSIKRSFPDVYTFENPNGEEANVVYKAFFFYSDTMNVRKTHSDIVTASPSWDDDMDEFMYERGATYRDIFMEKFYWMGVRSIYKGIMVTNSRWEAIEYVQDNASYDRFNQLFLNTMDPYFKMGLATYLKSSDFEFPFDYAVDKMNEAINTKFLGYQKVANYEIYLDKTWSPSYFDFITKIIDGWNYSAHLVKRPSSTFDTNRIIKIISRMQNVIRDESNTLTSQITESLKKINSNKYIISTANLDELLKQSENLGLNINSLSQFISNLDLEIYTTKHVEMMGTMLNNHLKIVDSMRNLFDSIYDDVVNNSRALPKRVILGKLEVLLKEDIIRDVDNIKTNLLDFDIEHFMYAVNNPAYFNEKEHNDDSIIGRINKFFSTWSKSIQDARNKLYESTVSLWTEYDTTKEYSIEKIENLLKMMHCVHDDLISLKNKIFDFWGNIKKDLNLVAHFDFSIEYITNGLESMNVYTANMKKLIEDCDKFRGLLVEFSEIGLTDIENNWILEIDEYIGHLISELSYLDIKSHSKNADESVDTIGDMLLRWSTYNFEEGSTFEDIMDYSKAPVYFITAMDEFKPLINSMITYIEYCGNTFVPDKSLPNYSDIYNEPIVEIINGGFGHKIGEKVYIPYVGIYKITGVSNDDISAVTALELDHLDNMFRDPVSEKRLYNATTNGSGLGIIVKVTSSTKRLIINDSATDPYIEKVKNIIYLVNRDKVAINPYNNESVETTMTKINQVSFDWDSLLSFYSDYLSSGKRKGIQNMINADNNLCPLLTNLVDTRSRIDFNSVMVNIDSLITDTYTLYEARHKLTPNYLYFDNRLRAVYDEMLDYYGNGTNWNDVAIMLALFDKIEYELQLFKRLVLDKTLGDPTIPENAHILELYNMIFNSINDIKVAIDELPDIINDIDEAILTIEEYIAKIPDNVIDKYYRITTSSISIGGNGYQIGDIVEIGDTGTYAQISNINKDNSVKEIHILIDYALSEQLYGAYETTSIVGNGEGLIISLVSSLVEKKDSTYFLDPSSDEIKPNQFDDNDLFAFMFENIHDLAIEYEVYFAGIQFTDFILRHEGSVTNMQPSDIDTIYLNANKVMNLQNAAVRIDGENYFIYKIDNVEIINPGKGYSLNQDIVVDSGQVALKLNVAEIEDNPYKQIKRIDLAKNYTLFNGTDPKSDFAEAVNDSLNNIDDEFNDGYYDHLTVEGIIKPLTRSYPVEEYPYTSVRFDNLEDGLRNKNYMYKSVNMPDTPDAAKDGDPDDHNYLGSRVDNSQVPFSNEHRWDGIEPVVPHMDPFIPDSDRTPTGKPILGEYQIIATARIFNSGKVDNSVPTRMSTEGEILRHMNLSSIQKKLKMGVDEPEIHSVNDVETIIVPTHEDIPQHIEEWATAEIGSIVIVQDDEKYNHHRMSYMIRSFMITGYIIYDSPEVADLAWNNFAIKWNEIDYYPDLPTLKAQYPDANWNADTYQDVQHDINDNDIEQKFIPDKHIGTYIHNLTVDDLSVYNYTAHRWEDLHSDGWELIVSDEGFKLIYHCDEVFSYDMRLYLNKIPDTQVRNAEIKENAVFKVSSYIYDEVDTKTKNISINTGRNLMVRKLFPFEQKELYILNKNDKVMTFRIANYMHFKNELHIEDVKLFNKTANRYEDIFNANMFEIRFKDPKAVQRGYETNTEIVQSIITDPGTGFTNGDVWAWNEEFKIQVFGQITADYLNDGAILSFEPIHCPTPPQEDIALEFQLYQHAIQWNTKSAQVIIEFQTNKTEVFGDGYIHNIKNRMAPLPKEFIIIVNYDIDGDMEYEIIIDKNPHIWEFVKDRWEIFPTFTLPGVNIQQDRLYITNDNGRIPLVNPSTGKPSMTVIENDNSTDVLYLNIYNKYEHLQIHSTPYPMRSVYVQRRIPSNGYVDVKGRINKPLNKKYFEFWLNGRLLSDEVTIISPTKFFIHGARSLRNLEIIEINRDTNEFFADNFIDYEITKYDSPYPKWNLNTYIDDALSGTLEGDNYTIEEQASLLTPVWEQVDAGNPEFKNYPSNLDVEPDILLRVDEYTDMSEVDSVPYQFAVIDVPSIEGIPINSRSLSFEDFGFKPLTNDQIINMLDEEWKDEIDKGIIDSHTIISDDEWYGMVTRLYDEYGMLVHTLNDAAYQITDPSMVRINTDNRTSRIVKTSVKYDLD